MNYAFMVLLGLLPELVLSAPPQRCDDIPHSMIGPQPPSPRIDALSRDQDKPAALPNRRQRIQNLKDRVDQLKSNLEKDLPVPTIDTKASPRLEIKDKSLEQRPSTKPPEPIRQVPVPPPVLIDLEPDLSPLPTAPPLPADRPAPAAESQTEEAPRPLSEVGTESQVENAPEPLAEMAPKPQTEEAQEPKREATPPPLPDPAPPPSFDRIAPPPEPPVPLPGFPVQVVPTPDTRSGDTSRIPEASLLSLPEELLDHPIDRQGMGNNLYAIGAYELALMNYEMMLRQPLSPLETQWVHFQVANCQRHLGQTSEAQKSYRRVTGETSEEWLGQMSRWWLKDLDDREQLQRRVAELDQVIKTLHQEVNRGP